MESPENRKGNAAMVTNMIVIVGVGVITIAVIAIMLGAFQSDLVTNTAGCGLNATGGTSGSLLYNNCSVEYNVTGRGLTFLDNATSKFGTAGTIVGVLFLLGILALGGLGGYALYKRTRQ